MESGELQLGAGALSEKEQARIDKQTAKLLSMVVGRNGVCVVGRKDKKATGLFIPNTYKGKPIVRIANNAFYACANLDSVIIPDSVTSIGDGAFCACSGLANLVFGEGIESIEASTFVCCSSLTSVVIPDKVKGIGDYAFAGCAKLETLVIGGGVTSIGERAFQDCRSIESLVIPNQLKSIAESGFYACVKLKAVYYQGTENEWEQVEIGPHNTELKEATKYFYSENQPTETGKYWHYVNGVPTVW